MVCENRTSMRNIRSEINYCLGNQPVIISLTNLTELQTGKRGDGDSVWLERSRKVSEGMVKFGGKTVQIKVSTEN